MRALVLVLVALPSLAEEPKPWIAEIAFTAPDRLGGCAVADVDPRPAGREVVAVGMASGSEDEGGPGAAQLLRWTGKGWAIEEIHRDTDLIHGVCIADLDAARPGNEILLVGFSGKATMVFRHGGGWTSEPAANLGAAGKNAVAFDGGAAVACTSGRLIHVKKGPDGWKSAILDEAPAGVARLGSDGARVVAVRCAASQG